MGNHELFFLFFSISSGGVVDGDSISESDCLVACSNFGDFDKFIVSFVAVIILDCDLIVKADDVGTGGNETIVDSGLAVEMDGLVMNGDEVLLLLGDVVPVEL